VFAAIRPDDFNFPLFLHVAGAMLLVGVIFSVSLSLALAGRTDGDGATRLTRMGLRTMLYAALPAYLLMRVGAQIIETKYDFGDSEPSWIGVGYITADLGLLLVIVSMVLSRIGLKRLGDGGGHKQARAVSIICALLLVAYLVAIFFMSAKPD
jgi:uncharacterized membrane protein